MKKVLLIAAVTLVAGLANAQSTLQGKAIKAKNAAVVEKNEVMSKANRQIKPYSGALMNGPVKNSLAKPFQFSAKTWASLKPATRTNVSPVRRAATLEKNYNGSGTNYQTKEAAEWVMGTEAGNNDTIWLIDVIPLPEVWASFENIAVPGTISGNTITVKPTLVASNDTHFFYLHSWASNDGSIVLTVGDNGSLATIEGEDIAYSAFKENTFDLSKDGPYDGLVLDIEKVKYTKEGEIVAPEAGYEPNGLFLNVSPNVNGNYYTNLLSPAYGDITLRSWTNMSCDGYSWSLQPVTYDAVASSMVPDGDPITSTEANLTYNSGNTTFEPATFTATNKGANSVAFTWNQGSWYAGGSDADWEQDGTPRYTMSKANPAGDLTYINTAGVKSVIMYQGKPASALYFTGITTFIYQFNQTDGQDLVLTCKIHKAHRDESGRFSLGDLIAQADVESKIEEGSWMSGSLVRLHWDNFYVEDLLGLTKDLPYLLIDEEFAVVFEGWDNGTFSGYPLAFTSVLPTGGLSSTFAITPTQETYSGSGWSGTFDCIVGFTDATYGYLHTEDDTNVTIPAEGGQAAIHVKPMYSNSDEAEQKTRLFLDETIEGNEVPDWLTVGFANEDYTTEFAFDLVFQAEALPEGVEGREATIVFMQEGARLTAHIVQGTVGSNGIANVTVTKTVGGQSFNLAGQRVNDTFKGILVKGGKKVVVK